MQAKVYDFDPAWDAPDEADEMGEYVLRDIEYKSSDNTLVLMNGMRSHTYKIMHTIESICEICNPSRSPLCTKECQEVCRLL